MIHLNERQQLAVDAEGNVLVTACPGSGKTRVLTSRVVEGVASLSSSKHRIIALTFTNRAADEIKNRLDRAGIASDSVWAGTIHSFALEWILRPYAPYNDRVRTGFSVADEYLSKRQLAELKMDRGMSRYEDILTTRRRDGSSLNTDPENASVYSEYQSRLQQLRLLDYDDILFYSYRLLVDIPEIARTLAAIIRLICVDEIQDTQDLQYGILSEIHKALPECPPTIFFVGDSDQSIYESLGAVPKSAVEISHEFGLDSIRRLKLEGNYRSTQRIIDFYQCFRPSDARIVSLTDYAQEAGLITFQDQSVYRDDLPTVIAQLISHSLELGVEPSDICVLAPQWPHIRPIGRSLVQLLPNTDFDAPGLSPFHCQRDNLWFKIARLFLTTPRPQLYTTRLRWANELIRGLQDAEGVHLTDSSAMPRFMLRLINSISSDQEEGMAYLRSVFDQMLTLLGIDLEYCRTLRESRETFFEKAQERITSLGASVATDVTSFRKLFRHPSGVVISTCHGIKGEEYETVIAFGLLRGYIPHWKEIYSNRHTAEDRESKLLYVICSRAKKRLHLIAESGRHTQKGNPYETATLLRRSDFDYDQPPALPDLEGALGGHHT